MKQVASALVVFVCLAAGPLAALPGGKTPAPQAWCNSMMAIMNWNDLKESANATNPDRVKGAGQIRLLGKHLAEASGHQNPSYQLFDPPQPGVPHSEVKPIQAENIAIASTSKDSVPKAAVDRLADLLNDGRNDWQNVRYFHLPFDPLMATEIASMWQRHARNSPLQETDGFQGDQILTQVQQAIENGSQGSEPFWAYVGLNGVVHTTEPDGALNLTNAGPGYADKIPKGTNVKLDYLVMFDPTDPQKPSGMTVVLRSARPSQSPSPEIGSQSHTKPPPVGLTATAEALAASFSPQQKDQGLQRFRSPEKLNWQYVPIASQDARTQGVYLKDLSPEQKEWVDSMLKEVLSPDGYRKVKAIQQLESVIAPEAVSAMGFDPVNYDPEFYKITLFGTPGGPRPWSWRFQGHHVSINVGVENGKITSVTPSFRGVWPTEVTHGEHTGLRAMDGEETLARDLVTSLTTRQLAKATRPISAIPQDLVQGPGYEPRPFDSKGLAASDLSFGQRQKLITLIDEYMGNYTDELTEQRRARIRALPPSQLSFSWSGDSKPGERHYYRIQGPDFIIEYINLDGQHIHSVWHDLK